MSFEIYQLIVDAATPLVSAGAAIGAAVIAAGKLGNIAKDSIDTYFVNYSDTQHDLARLLRKAKYSITFVVLYGDAMLDKYEQDIRKCLKRNVSVRYLMVTPEHAEALDKDFFCSEKWQETRGKITTVMQRLQGLASDGNFEVRRWKKQMPASYIAVDALPHEQHEGSVIQMMVYQYCTPSEKSPITYLTNKKNETEFSTTVGSIECMWDNAEAVALDEQAL